MQTFIVRLYNTPLFLKLAPLAPLSAPYLGATTALHAVVEPATPPTAKPLTVFGICRPYQVTVQNHIPLSEISLEVFPYFF